MAKIYYYRVRDKKMSIDEVPERWREATQGLLDADKATEVSEEDTPAAQSVTEGNTEAAEV